MKNALLIGILSLVVVCSANAQELKVSEKSSAGTVEQREDFESAQQAPAVDAADSIGLQKPRAGEAEGREIQEAQKSYEAGVALFEAGKLPEAIAALKQAKKLNPEDAQTNYMLGMVYSKSRSYKEAAESFKRAAKFKPDWPEAHFQSGVMSYVLGRRSDSIDEYRRLIELNSPLANALYHIIKEESGPVEGILSEPSVLPAARSVEVASVSASMGAISTPDASSSSGTQKAAGDETAQTSEKTIGSSAAAAGVDDGDVQLTSVYKIGIGDVLDIRFLNSTSNRSTLYTVLDGGVIDLPIAGGRVAVGGLTTEEVQVRITAELKRRAVEEESQVTVGVRQYVSHTVLITGLVGNPGRKVLRREAVPLYVIMAEAQPRLDAAVATIVREGIGPRSFNLSDLGTLSFVVRPGDVISVVARPQEFYYIGGRINYPGQKVFQPGITLLQAILAAGGVSRPGEGTVELSRESADGHLITTKVALKEIKSGKIPDPRLQAGDRIEIVR